MKTTFFRFIALASAVVLPLSCSPDFADVNPDTFDATKDSGEADFSVYVAIGNSLTAGIQSSGQGAAGWRSAFQAVSYPNLIAQQLGKGDSFTQPLLDGDGPSGWVDFNDPPFDSLGNPRLITRNSNLDATPSGPAPYHNMGVPGALLIEAPTVTSSANSLSSNTAFDIVLQGQTWAERANALGATFISFWLGNNEVLGAATQGSGTALATADQFGAAFSAMMTALTAGGADMVVANVPDVTTIPFVTTIALSTVDNLQELNAALPDAPTEFAETDIAYVLLSAQAAFEAGYGIPTVSGGLGPLPGTFTLTQSEVTSLRNTVNAYNAKISEIASAMDIPIMNANQLLKDIAAVSGPTGTGYHIGGGIRVKADFISGGIFSLDGVHTNTLGYAVIANEFIKTINAHYGSSIPLLDVTNYMGGVVLP